PAMTMANHPKPWTVGFEPVQLEEMLRRPLLVRLDLRARPVTHPRQHRIQRLRVAARPRALSSSIARACFAAAVNLTPWSARGALASIFLFYRIIRNPIAISTKAKVHIAK